MSAADDITDLFIHSVTVETATGRDQFGAVSYAPLSGPLPCFVDDTQSRVFDAAGSEVISPTRLFLRLSDAPRVPPDSRVYLPGRTATVITRTVADGEALGLPSHTVAALDSMSR